MDLLPSTDQLELVGTVGRFLSRELSVARLHEGLRTGAALDPQVWSRTGGLGVFSLGLPEEAGGAGRPAVEEALVFREIGRHLAPIGLLASLLAARMAHAAGNQELRDALVAGERVVAAALTGRADGVLHVFDLGIADYVLHWRAGVPVLSAAGTLDRREPIEGLDPSAELTRVAAPAFEPALEAPAGMAEELTRLGTLLSAAMLVGIAEAVKDDSVRHAREREQFGRPIGVNQAVKHPCADMATRCEAAASLLFFAALALRDRRADAAFQVAAAKRIAVRAAYDNARANVQIHGGMGVTWEHDAHLYLTRTHVLEQIFGDARESRLAVLGTAPSVP
jgi:alkylation response protein AidB-like acyl-CoA dehydrogenase